MKLSIDEIGTTLEFEMSELYEGVCGLSGCGGLPASIADATFYYDESGNAHHVVVRGGKDLNLKKEDRIFVLGGVLAKHGITSDELRTAMGKDSAAEIKSAKLLHGDFCQVLRKENTNRILKLILDKKWLVHFHMVQPLYFAYVDIVDSIEFDAANHIGLKDALYRALEDEFDQTLALFKRAKYPRVKPSDRDMFLNGVLEIVRHYVAAHGETPWTRLLSEKLSAKLNEKGGDDGLLFLEGDDLTPHSWIDRYAAALGNANAVYNYYSTGDEIFHETPNPPWLLEGMGDSSANYAWQKQETKKGSRFVAGTAYGGWGFHKWRIAGFDYQYTAAEAASMVADGSVTNNPVFNRGYAPMLSNDATEDGVMCSLAKYVPAVSSPVGGTPLFSSDENAGNLNDARYRSGWVNDGSRGTSWKHSDMKDVSYFYVWPLYTEIVNEKGTLK